MPNYRLRFGDYDFPLSLRPSASNTSQNTAAQSRPRGSGAVTQTARREIETLEIEGEITASTPAQLFALLRAIKAACLSGKQKLWFGVDDEYYKDAQCIGFKPDWAKGFAFGVWASISAQFQAADYPEPFGTNTQSVSLPVAGGTITNPGTADALPTWTITVGTGGLGAFVLKNTATGESAQLDNGSAGWAAGDVLVLQRDGGKVVRNGIERFDLLEYKIPRLTHGANPITLTSLGAATASALACDYIPRNR